jgi:hypothetical protein
MNFIWPRILKTAYRREPISSFLIIVGAVDATIGGLGSYGSLIFLGLTTVGGAIALRWWQVQHSKKNLQPERVAQHYLPSRSSRPQLPMLSISKKRPPN